MQRARFHLSKGVKVLNGFLLIKISVYSYQVLGYLRCCLFLELAGFTPHKITPGRVLNTAECFYTIPKGRIKYLSITLFKDTPQGGQGELVSPVHAKYLYLYFININSI